MTRLELLTAVKNRIDEIDQDDQIDAILNPAFNNGYRYELGALDKRLTTAYVPIINGIATLPDDLLDIEKMTPEIQETDRLVGKNIITTLTGTFNVVYSSIRDEITDSTELDLDVPLQYLLILYCCIAFYESKKKTEVVDMYRREYENGISEYKVNKEDFVEEVVKDVYSTTTEV